MADVPEQKNFITRYIAVLKSLANKAKKGVKQVTGGTKNGKESKILKFLSEILVVLAGVSAIKKVVTNTLVTEIPVIENYLKTALKDTLKEYISCGVNTPIPDYLKYNGPGVNITLRNIDYVGLYHIKPTSENGNILYSDPNGGANSVNFDTFMYERVVNPGTEYGWGASTLGSDILAIKFLQTSSNGNNVVNIRASNDYSNYKTMTDLNNDFIDSLTLLPTAKMITDIMEATFSPISAKLNFPKDWFKKQEEINVLIQKLSEIEEKIEIDDSFFEFTNDEKFSINQIANDRSNGIRKLENCDEFTSEISIDTMTDINNAMLTATTSTLVDLKETVTNSLTQLSEEVSRNVPDKDKFKFELEFFSVVFDGLFNAIGNTMLSPKIAMLLQLNNKIVYGETEPEFKSPSELISKNKVLYHKLITLVTTILSAILIKLVIKYIKKLIKENSAADAAEALKSRQDQLMSLVGGGQLPDLSILSQFSQLNIT